MAIATSGTTGYDSPAMGDERRWAARYQFLDELWRGRDRIVCDRELEAALHAGVEGPLGELLARLIPSEGSGERAWVALHNDRRAASFARERSGTVFVAIDEAAEIASDETWQIALVNLSSSSDPAAAPSTRAELLGPGVESFLEVLGERLEDDPERSVVLTIPCGSDEDRSYDLLSELVEELFGDGRIYGLTRPGMAAFYDFGPVIEASGEGAGDDVEADIEVDNSLGSETPRFDAFLAVVGARVPGEGVTFVELPPAAPSAAEQRGIAPVGDDDLGALRATLAEAQRRGDLQAIERQALLEKLEQAEDRIASLEEELDEAAAGVGAAPSPGGPSGSAEGPRIDELLAREQTLRWELERMRGEVERLEARPVEELEAEVASLRAELDRTRAELEAAEFDEEGADTAAAELAELALLLDDADEPAPARIREWRQARSKLDHLLRKLERGGRLSALELHRELVGLKKLL